MTASVIHYFVTLIFFIVTVKLVFDTIVATNNANIDHGDENAVSAYNLMVSASVFGAVMIFLIIIGLITIGIMGWYSKEFNTLALTLKPYTKADGFFEVLRVLTFSLLIFTSFVMGTLLLSALALFNESQDPNRYIEQSTVCFDVGRVMYIHIILLMLIQFLIFTYTLYQAQQKLKNECDIKIKTI